MFRKIAVAGFAPRPISVEIDGKPCTAEEGEPLAAVLLRNPPFFSRHMPVSGAIRAPFCMMGACFDCLVEVNGTTSLRGCLISVQNGMIVRRQPRLPDALSDTKR